MYDIVSFLRQDVVCDWRLAIFSVFSCGKTTSQEHKVKTDQLPVFFLQIF